MSQHPTNEFAIVANGKNFDAEDCARRSPLPITHCWKRSGLVPNRPNVAQHKSGVQIDLGNGPELPIQEQQEIATAFLEANAAALIELRSFPGVETFYLGLQEEVLRASLGSIIDLDPALMRIVLKIGIQVTIWACLESDPTRPMTN